MAFSDHHQWGVCIQSDGGSAIVYFLKVTRHNGAVTDTFFMADPAYNGCHTDPIVTVHRCLAMINQLWSRGARKKIRFNYQLRATLGGTCTTLGSDPVSNMTHLSRLARDIACKKKELQLCCTCWCRVYERLIEFQKGRLINQPLAGDCHTKEFLNCNTFSSKIKKDRDTMKIVAPN